MIDKHLLKVNKRPTNEEFLSDTWTNRLDYVGLVKKDGGGVDTNEVFYNFDGTKVTKLKVKIEKPGYYGLANISGDISEDKPTIINWGNGQPTKLTTPITSGSGANNSTDWHTNYDKPGEYEISIDGWYNHFKCCDASIIKPGVTQINYVLTEIIQVSSLITSFSYTFYNCTGLTSIPIWLFDKNPNVTDFESVFMGCSSLTRIPIGLFDKNTNIDNIQQAFAGCSNITGETPYTLADDGVSKIKLWQRGGTNGFAKPKYAGWAFRGCTKLDDHDEIPDNWK